jgi:Ca2+-transporting ATPase
LYIFLAASAFVLCLNSEKKYGYLYKAARPKALVVRNGRRKNVFIESIVPGDIILLSAGDIVPADARLVFADSFMCVRVNRNGEPFPMRKTAEVISGNYANYADSGNAPNTVYASDVVGYGYASAIVTATGRDTYAASLSRSKSKSSLNSNAEEAREVSAESSFMQRGAYWLSKNFFLASVFLSGLILFWGLLLGRDIIDLLLTCLAVSAACFSEQIPIVADHAAMRSMHRMAKLGILVKKSSIIDEINTMDMIIAKKNESFTQDKMQLAAIDGCEVIPENLPQISRILSYAAICSNVAVTVSGGKKKIYAASAIDAAVFAALDKCGLDYDGINQTYQKIGKTIYNRGVKSAIAVTDKKFNLVCFGEAFNIIGRCAFDGGSPGFHREKAGDLYREYDLVMAVAAKDFNYRYADNLQVLNAETKSDLAFLGFVCFSEPKTPAVFESIDYLKKSGITPVMIADSDTAYTRNAAVKLGVVKNLASAHICDDGRIAAMGDAKFYINAENIRIFTPISLHNRIKLLRALEFKNKSPAVTINDMTEIPLLEMPCVFFTSVNTETGVLKNKASVITKNLAVSTVLKTVKNAVLVFRNTSRVAHFSSAIFMSQYLLVVFAAMLNGAFINTPAQIIWGGICAGYIFAVSMCFNEENRQWHILRRRIKEYKDARKFNRAVLKYGFIYGFLIFLFTAASFLICMTIKGGAPVSGFGIIVAYVNSGAGAAGSATDNIASAQTAAFVTYIAACISMSLNYSARFFDLNFRAFKNKVFLFAVILNISAVAAAVFIPFVREFLGFGEISLTVLGISVLAGLFPAVIAKLLLFRKGIFFQ